MRATALLRAATLVAAMMMSVAARGAEPDWTLGGPNVSMWAVATTELYLTLAMPLVATQKTKTATTMGAVIGTTGVPSTFAVAYLAYRGHADTRFPQAVHGALWTGGELFALGAFAEQRVGPAAVALGAVGAVAGGLTGALVVRTDQGRWFWLAAAPAGFGVGGAVVFVEAFALATGTASGATADRILAGTISGFALAGLATGYVGGIASGRAHASVGLGPNGLTLSGTF